MSSVNSSLAGIIRDEIRSTGAISFARFMEHALYHPEFGYYASDRAVLGRQGDYFTNVSVGSIFGQLLAAQFIDIWRSLGEPSDFVLVEQGAHHGELAHDVLHSLEDQAPEMFRRLRYYIVEPFSLLQTRQRETLSGYCGQVTWFESLESLTPFGGVHFSNELLDAMPVHLLAAGPDASDPWKERCVALDEDEFDFRDMPVRDTALLAHARKLPFRPAGYATEVNLAALQFVRQLSQKLVRGCMIAIDYGCARPEFYDEERASGKMQSRARHRVLSSPFAAIGNSDITAHVEWTSIAEEAETCGFSLAGFTDQHHFFTALISEAPHLVESLSDKSRRALQTLLHPEMLGRSFQVLCLSKGVPANLRVSGFKFARDARDALAL